MGTLGVYIHIPFCLRKCHYCDFVSYPGMHGDIDEYIDALITEAKLYEAYLSSREIDSVFIGGGTPSLLSPAQIEKLVLGLQSATNFNPLEFTIESNPETLDEQKLKAYKNMGVNRLSIGLQTHEDEILRTIGRCHTFKDFLSAYETAQKHINNINVDTIFGLPRQTINSFCETICAMIALSPDHISSYALKLEQGTKLYGSYFGPDDETDREMYHSAIDLLCDAGYNHYETSNFAKPNRECKHNLKYWTGEEYLGLGVAAHSFANGDTRTSNVADIKQYMKLIHDGKKPVDDVIKLDAADLHEEYLMLRLRLSQGIVLNDYANKFDCRFEKRYADAIDMAVSAGLVHIDDTAMRPTIKGFDLQNSLISIFMKKM